MPRGTPVVESFARAERLFGLGFLIDQRGQVCTSTGMGLDAETRASLKLSDNFYIWTSTPPGWWLLFT